MSNTPETDAKASPHIGFYSCATVPANFARALEQERDEARRQCLQWLEEWHLTDKVRRDTKAERDEARSVAGAMADIAFKHLTSLLSSTPHFKDAAHEEETQQVIAAIKRWKELKV